MDAPQRPEGVAAAFAPASVCSSAKPSSDNTYSLFFYGTLIHPSILAKVIASPGTHISVQPAILEDYVLHHVKKEDYPGLVSVEGSSQVMNKHDRPLADSQESSLVRGTIVRGLKESDVARLDAFEGDEYRRISVNVRPDTQVMAIRNDSRPRDESIAQILSSLTSERVRELRTGTSEPANVYSWNAPLSLLEPEIWTFERFTASGKDRRWWA